jgi:hypothetical protein
MVTVMVGQAVRVLPLFLISECVPPKDTEDRHNTIPASEPRAFLVKFFMLVI